MRACRMSSCVTRSVGISMPSTMYEITTREGLIVDSSSTSLGGL